MPAPIEVPVDSRNQPASTLDALRRPADRLFPQVQERMLGLSEKVMFCIAVDRNGLSAARNTRPFLLQTYRRDMGAGEFVVLKETSAPIMVNGKLWGGLRLAYQF